MSWKHEVIANNQLNDNDFLNSIMHAAQQMNGKGLIKALDLADDNELSNFFMSLAMQKTIRAEQAFSDEQMQNFDSDQRFTINDYMIKAFVDLNQDIKLACEAHRGRLEGLQINIEQQGIEASGLMANLRADQQDQLTELQELFSNCIATNTLISQFLE